MQLIWKTAWQFLRKIKHRVTIWPSNYTPNNIPKRIKTYVHTHTHTHKMYMNIYSNMIHNQKSGNSPNAQSWWMNKQSTVYPYNGVLLSNKKWMRFWHMLQHDWIWKHCAKWKKPKSHILYESIYMKCPE